MFETKDEKIRNLEKRIEAMERRINRNFMRVNDSLQTVTDVITRLEKENGELKKDRDFLVEKHRELLRSVESESRLVKEMKEKIIGPAREGIRQDIELLKDVVKDGIARNRRDELFDMVMKSGSIKIREAARKLNVHDLQIETWARDLEKAGLLDIRDSELRKKA